MKTLFLFDSTSEHSKFFELEGNYRRLDKVIVNDFNADPVLIKELIEILFTEDGSYKVNFFDTPTRDWDFFVHVGILD